MKSVIWWPVLGGIGIGIGVLFLMAYRGRGAIYSGDAFVVWIEQGIIRIIARVFVYEQRDCGGCRVRWKSIMKRGS